MKIAVIPGDGIGVEVMEAALHILNTLDLDLEFIHADAGDAALKGQGRHCQRRPLKPWVKPGQPSSGGG